MKKTGKKIKIAISVVLILLVAFASRHFLPTKTDVTFSPKGEDTERLESNQLERTRSLTPAHVAAEQQGMETFLATFKNPIKLYGRVVDQFGDPVPEAYVDLNPVTSPTDEGSDNHPILMTDANGEFSVDGLRGFSLGVRARKDGYLQYPPLGGKSSSENLGYSGRNNTGHAYESRNSPLTLELLKVVAGEPTIHVKKKRWDLSLDGTPRIIALDTEEGHGDHRIEFRLWSDTHIRELPGNNSYTAFDWSFEVRVPGGGLVWDESDAKFEAPETGYKEKVRYEYSDTMPREKWKRARAGRYFVRFGDGSYGRIQFTIDAGSDRRSLHMQSWLSLKPGSRNLATENMIIKVIESEAPEGGSTDE